MIYKKDISLTDCQIKLSNNSGTFTGYASVFDGSDSYNDTVLKGAFSKTLVNRSRPPLMLFGHDPSKVIGKWIALSEDTSGLVVKGEFTPNHTEAQNAYASLKHGAIDGLSIGYRIPKGGFDEKEDNGRNLKEIELVEISIVTMPADDAARISVVKSEIDKIKSLKDAEYFLREADGFSRATARDFVSVIWREAKMKLGNIRSDEEKYLHEQRELKLLIDRINAM